MKIIVFIMIVSACSLLGQDSTYKKIVVLPFTGSGLAESDILTAESIFNFELAQKSNLKIIPQEKVNLKLEGSNCFDIDCALKTGKLLGADFVLGCKLMVLGDKIIVQYFLMDIVNLKELVRDQTTSSTVEDLEVVMKRIAKSVIITAPLNENVEVGTIMQKEAETPLRRATTRNFGLAFGYAFPQEGYGSTERSFTFDLRGGYEMDDFAIGMLLGLRKGFAMNIYGHYLFSRTDVSPYLGGAFGFHWVLNEKNFFNDNKRGDGFEITVCGGLRVFRTYNFEVIFNLEYIQTLNDFNSRAFVFTIGLL
jgi:hypothetical protein